MTPRPLLFPLLLVALLPAFNNAVDTANGQSPRLLPQDCGRGIVKAEIESRRIVGPGDTEAEYGEFPWQARLEVLNRTTRSYTHLCGGVIISSKHVLTAAHCLNGVALSSLQVRVGDHSADVRESSEQEFGVQDIRVHDQYFQAGGISNDIALLLLRSRAGQGIPFGRHVQPACLPAADSEYEVNLQCEVSGWGKTSDTSAISDVLRHVDVFLTSDTYCVSPEVYGPDRFKPGLMTCAGLTRGGGQDACQGDSGGPLVCKNRPSDTFIAYGIVSSGDPEGCGKHPGIYTKVSSYIGWILRWLSFDAAGEGPGQSSSGPGQSTPLLTGSSDGQCGVSSFTKSSTAKWEAPIGKYPWHAEVSSADSICDGVLISDRHVLTTGRCVHNFGLGTKLTVYLGDHNLLTTRDCQGSVCAEAPQVIEVSQVHVHPNYQDDSKARDRHHNDLAVLKLAKKATFNRFVRPICLLDRFTEDLLLSPDSKQVLTGYTLTPVSTSSSLPFILYEAPASYVSDADCASLESCCNDVSDVVNICAQSELNGLTAVPLILEADGVFYLLGLHSYNMHARGISGYTRISGYVDWIKDVMASRKN